MARRKKGNPVHGWVVFDKPLEMTSTQAVGKVRWLFKAQKAGHGGTLDPLATGILPIALGEATKTMPFTVDATKDYTFTITWGENTDTLDAEGEVIARSETRPLHEDIENLLSDFIGDIEQIPPKYSAIKIDGKRAYDLARAGEEVEIKSRIVSVYDLTLTRTTADTATFHVHCGKGTYVRSLARDIAERLGVCGHVTLLRRTRVGPFNLETAFSLDDLEKLCHRGAVLDGLLPVETALDDIPVLNATKEQVEHLKHGRAIFVPAMQFQENMSETADWILVMYGEAAIALCTPRDGHLYPKRVFNM